MVCLFGWVAFFVCGQTKAAGEAAPASLAAETQARLDWNLKTTVGAYQKSSFKGAAWDDYAVKALTEFARIRSKAETDTETGNLVISSNTAAAVRAGCKDPMVNNLFIRFAMTQTLLTQTNRKMAYADAFCKNAAAMENSAYPDIRKFYADFHAVHQYAWANNYPTNTPPEVDAVRHHMFGHLESLMKDKTIPPEEIYDACSEFLNLFRSSKESFPACWKCLEPLLVNNWSNEPTAYLLKGEAYIDLAWLARGGEYADKVNEEGWKLFKENLELAEQALNRAWELNKNDARVAVKMMTVELGQGIGRDRMELWFSRAMRIDPNNYEACNSKVLYLEPKWYGSIEKMLSFGRECVANKQWGGRTPLVLVNAHSDIPIYYLKDSEKANYWTRPGVWPDIKAAYNRLFELNPNSAAWRRDYARYARYAFLCGHWDEFLSQAAVFRGGTDFSYFGGKEKFDKLVANARRPIVETKAPSE